MNTQKVIYPGTFDPVTNGHVDIIRRAASMFDEVLVAVAASPSKKTMFNLEERVDLVTQACVSLDNVIIMGFSGLLIDFAQQQDTNILLRGLRTTVDFEYELGLTSMYRRLLPNLENIFLTPTEEYAFLSSTIVREVAIHGGNVSRFVPECVQNAIKQKAS